MAVSANQLDDMDLSPHAIGDQALLHGHHAQRLQAQNAIVATNHSSKPTGEKFFNTVPFTSTSAARCNMPCHMVTCSAVIVGGGTAGANLTLDPETYYMKKEGKVWIEKHLTWNNGETKDTKSLTLASPPNSYSIVNYFEYTPKSMRDTPDYTTAFFNKHTGANPLLTMANIDTTFMSFKCNLEMFHQDDVDEHTMATHGISSPNTLKPRSTIEVDAKIPFVLDSAHDIEQVGSDRRKQIFHDIFNRCVSRGVFSKTTSKNVADLNENRSVEFLAELKKLPPLLIILALQ